MIFADDVADDARRFAVRLVPTRSRSRASNRGCAGAPASARRARRAARGHDHAHGVIEVAALHFVGDRNRTNVGTRGSGAVFFIIGQGKSSKLRRSLLYNQSWPKRPAGQAPKSLKICIIFRYLSICDGMFTRGWARHLPLSRQSVVASLFRRPQSRCDSAFEGQLARQKIPDSFAERRDGEEAIGMAEGTVDFGRLDRRAALGDSGGRRALSARKT